MTTECPTAGRQLCLRKEALDAVGNIHPSFRRPLELTRRFEQCINNTATGKILAPWTGVVKRAANMLSSCIEKFRTQFRFQFLSSLLCCLPGSTSSQISLGARWRTWSHPLFLLGFIFNRKYQVIYPRALIFRDTYWKCIDELIWHWEFTPK